MHSLRSWLHSGWSWLVGGSPSKGQEAATQQAASRRKQGPAQSSGIHTAGQSDQTPDKHLRVKGDAGFSFAPATTAYPQQQQQGTQPATTPADGASTPLMMPGARQEEAPEPTPKPLGERFLVKDGMTVGLENTVRRYAPHRPVTLHSTPFDKRLDAQLQREMEVIQAATQPDGSSSTPGKSGDESSLALPRLALTDRTNSLAA